MILYDYNTNPVINARPPLVEVHTLYARKNRKIHHEEREGHEG